MSADQFSQLREIFEAMNKPGIHHVEIAHDSDCPAIGTGQGCICEPKISVVDEAIAVKNIVQTRQQRRAAEREASKALKKARKP